MDSFGGAGQRARELAEALHSLVLEDYGPPWAPGSRVATEVKDDPVYSGRLGTRPIQDATMAAVWALSVAHDHLVGMAHLFPAEHTISTPITLGRTVVAACARASWLLDPTVDGRERLRRHLNSELVSLRERANLVGPGLDNPTARQLVTKTLAITQTAPQFGWTVRRETKLPRGQAVPLRWLDERAPSEMTMVHKLLAVDGDETGRMVYRVASATVHAQPHTIALLTLRPEGPRVDGVGRAAMGIGLPELLTYTVGAVLGVFTPGLRAREHAGLPAREWIDATLPILRAWRDGMSVGGGA